MSSLKKALTKVRLASWATRPCMPTTAAAPALISFDAADAKKIFDDRLRRDEGWSGLGRGSYVEEVGLEGVAADEEADVEKFFAGAIVADVV